MKPGPRGDGRKAAKDVPDVVLLQAALGFAVGGRFPLDSLSVRFPEIPRKVLVQKQRRMVEKGLMTNAWTLTAVGLARLKELEAGE